MTVGLNSRPKEWSRSPELHPPDAGCWCSRSQRRPYVSLIWCGTPSGHREGLRPWIRTNGWGTANDLNPTLDFEHAHVSSHSRDRGSMRKDRQWLFLLARPYELSVGRMPPS